MKIKWRDKRIDYLFLVCQYLYVFQGKSVRHQVITVYISPHKVFLWWHFCMEWINLVGDVTLRQSWSIKFVIANRAVRAELNGKCAAQACLWVYSTPEDMGLHFDSAARPIYSALTCSYVDADNNFTGLLHIDFSSIVNETADVKKKKERKKQPLHPILQIKFSIELSCDGWLRHPRSSTVKLTYTTDCQ